MDALTSTAPWPVREALAQALPAIPPPKVRAAVRRLPSAALGSHASALAAAVRPLNAQMLRVALSPREAAAPEHGHLLPLVFHHPGHGWCALMRVDGGLALLRQDHPAAGLESHTAQSVASALNWALDAPQVFFRVETERPLEGPPQAAGGKLSPWSHLWRLLQNERPALLTALVYSAATGLLTLAIPVAVQALVNSLAFTALLQPLVVVGAMLSAGLAFAAGLRALQWLVVEHVQRRLFVRVVVDTSHRLLSDHSAKPAALNYYYDIFLLQKGVATLAVDGVSLLLQMVVAALLLGAYHPFLLAFDVALMLGCAVVVAATSGHALRSALEESTAKHDLAAGLQQMTLVADGERESAREAVLDFAAAWLSARKRHARGIFVQISAGLALAVIANAGVLLVGGGLVVQGKLTLGQLVAAELVVSALALGLSRIGKYLETLFDVLAAAAKVGHLRELGTGGHHG